MLTSLEKTPRLDAVCSNFLAQALNISSDRNISVHQWDKCTAEGNGDCQATLVPSWLDLTKTIFLLMIWTTPGCDTLVQKQRSHCQTDTLHKPSRASGIYGCVYCKHTIKARRKSFRQLIKGAGLEGHWLFLFTCFLVLHVIISKKVCILPPLGSALL